MRVWYPILLELLLTFVFHNAAPFNGSLSFSLQLIRLCAPLTCHRFTITLTSLTLGSLAPRTHLLCHVTQPCMSTTLAISIDQLAKMVTAAPSKKGAFSIAVDGAPSRDQRPCVPTS
jgi:hypothetical protein